MNTTLRSILPLLTGTFVGALGAMMLQRSLPPAEGSAEERIAVLENNLKKTRTELRAWEDTSPRKRFGTTHDNVRSLAKAIKEGRPVSPDDIFNSFKPLMRDLSPLTERMRMIESKRSAESLAGQYARKFGLNDAQQNSLVETLVAQNNLESEALSKILESDHTSMRDYMKAQREMNPTKALDDFMAATLKGEQRTGYLAERITEKSVRVQSEADGKVQRMDDIVKLDDRQRHQAFLYMAQGSRDYDPQMQFDGLQDGLKPLGQATSAEDAMLSVLRPEQRAAYDQHRNQRLNKAREEAAALGLSLPNDWNPDDDFGF
jgi:hypothetical protein